MFGGFFNRMYYGDPRKPDLKEENLKNQRFKLFFLVLQIRFWKIIQLNILYSIFWLPAFLLGYLQLVVMAETGEPLSVLFFVLLTLAIMIAGPATAGMVYVLRNWARDEHAWLFLDFKDSWKRNWKEAILVMLINGIVVTLLYVNYMFYRDLAGQSVLFLIINYFMIILAIIYAMMNIYIFPMLVTYKLTVKQIFKNAFIFTIVKLPQTFAVFVVMLAIFALSTYYIFPIFILGLAFPGLIGVSLANWVFDSYMNRNSDDLD
jgi:uncharacterized membrane protein YesL